MAFTLTIEELLESGAHYGHQKSRWNPLMRPFIYQERNGVHIMNLALTLTYAEEAYQRVVHEVSHGGSVLFVGTKPQAREPLKAEAVRAEQHYMVHRWLGGTLTNFRTIRKSVEKIRHYQKLEEEGAFGQMTKKEALAITRERDKLLENLEGILELKRLPSLVFIVDVGQDSIAVDEANKLGIPVIGLCDSNTDPGRVDLPVPANDDAVRSIRLFAALIADACIDGEAQRQENLRAEEEGAVVPGTESLAEQFIGAEEEEDLLSGRRVIKKIGKREGEEAGAEGEGEAAEGAEGEAAEGTDAAAAGAEAAAESGKDAGEGEAKEAAEADAKDAKAAEADAAEDEAKAEPKKAAKKPAKKATAKKSTTKKTTTKSTKASASKAKAKTKAKDEEAESEDKAADAGEEE